jgi:hypothetical protein
MKATGAKPEQIAGEVAKDITGLAGFSYGFRIGYAEGLPIKFWGKTGHAPTEFIEPQVLKGKQEFPTSHEPASKLLEEFKTGEFKFQEELGGWHATSSPFAKTTMTQIGTSEHPGLYISPSLSPHFLGLPGETSMSYAVKASSGTGAKALWIGTDIEISDVTTKGLTTFLMKEAGTPKGFIFSKEFPMIKSEKQAIIPPLTQLTRTSTGMFGFSDFVKISNVRVPIMTYKAASGGGMLAKTLLSMPTISESLVSASRVSSVASVGLVGLSKISSASKSSISKPLLVSKSTPSSTVKFSLPISSSIKVSSPISSSLVSSLKISSSISTPSSPSISIPSSPSIPSVPSITSKPSLPSYPSKPSYPTSPLISRPSYSPSSNPNEPSNFPPSMPPMTFGLGKGFNKRKQRPFRFGVQKLKYQPSVAGVLLGRYVSKAPKGKLTGIGIRPMVGRKPKKSKGFNLKFGVRM